jgi:hypothetical protein
VAFRKHQEKRGTPKEIRTCDVLAAIFAVNRAAKRWRDAAQQHYLNSRHGQARIARQNKERLYALKERGIAAAYSAGRIDVVEIHGGMCLYRGEGYSFHSRLVPIELTDTIPIGEVSPVLIDAKPQGRKEPRQIDAIACLDALPQVDQSAFDELETPRLPRSPIVCWSCGCEGHRASECDFDDSDILPFRQSA